MESIPSREFSDFSWPTDADARLLRMEATFCIFIIRCGVKVEEFAVVAESLEAMSKSFGYEKASKVAIREDLTMPLQKSGRARAEIDGNIKNLSPQAANELRLGIGWVLEVEAASGSCLSSKGMIDLLDRAPERDLGELLGGENALQIAAIVSSRMAFRDDSSIQRGGVKSKTLAHRQVAPS